MLLDRASALVFKEDEEKLATLGELANELRNGQHINGEMVLDNYCVMMTLISLSARASPVRISTASLEILELLIVDLASAERLYGQHPKLMPILMENLEQSSLEEAVQVGALRVMQGLTISLRNAKEMVVRNAGLLPLLVSKLECGSSKQLQTAFSSLLNSLLLHCELAALSPTLLTAVLSQLLIQMSLATHPTVAAKAIYTLSCFQANRETLCRDQLVLAALAQGRENLDTRLLCLLTLVNLFGAEESSDWLEIGVLPELVDLLAQAVDTGGEELNLPLLAFRHLCVVPRYRQVLWNEHRLPIVVLAAAGLAIQVQDWAAADNALSALAQFTNDSEALAWMRNNRSALDQVIYQLEFLSPALTTAQYLLLVVNPPPKLAPPIAPGFMISCHQDNTAQARLLCQLLQANGFAVWFNNDDSEQANAAEAMSSAMKQCAVMLVLVSRMYKESPLSQIECRFARDNDCELVSVLVEQECVVDGWLEALLAGAPMYDMGQTKSRAQVEAMVQILLQNVATTMTSVKKPRRTVVKSEPGS
ncbi:hypothetical protein BASA81_000735 [Batrachochytrium salamandrivorans]|nr:hypothetical protein BASA81_000735 [Batrachochytrium salamandrivorans]